MPDTPESWSLDITAAGSHAYDVRIVHPSRAETRHRVTVPEPLMAELGLSAAQEPLLVRASLAYLIEHSPAALPDRFALDEVGRAIPEYRDEIVARI
ncbi:MAG TPA: hypothetical protein VF423_08170 [Actinomycetes bacterium]